MIWKLFQKESKPKGRTVVGALKPYDRKKVEEDWEKVEHLVQVGKPSAIKEAVIVADKLLDYVLQQISFGETMGERLKNVRGAFPHGIYQRIWEAHKVRNALVHDANYDLTRLVAQEALGKFKEAFKALGVKL